MKKKPVPSRDGYQGPYSPLPSPYPLPPTVPPVTGGGPMLSRPKESPAVRKINRAFERVSTALKEYQITCDGHGYPIRSVTYRIEDNGCSKINVVKRKVKK